MKWGEYSSDVQFILQRSDQPNKSDQTTSIKNPASSPPQANESPKKAKSTFDQSVSQPIFDEKLSASPLNGENSIKNDNNDSIKTNELRRTDLIGIVKGKFLFDFIFRTRNDSIRMFFKKPIDYYFRCTTYNDAKFNENIATTFAMLFDNWYIDNYSQ